MYYEKPVRKRQKWEEEDESSQVRGRVVKVKVKKMPKWSAVHIIVQENAEVEGQVQAQPRQMIGQVEGQVSRIEAQQP